VAVIALVLARFIQSTWHTLRTDAEFRALFYVVTFLLGAGMFFYWRIEHWSLIDSFYFSVITLATVGYGDLAPTHTISKLFTIVYIFIGLGTLLLFINKMTELATTQSPDKKGIVPRLHRAAHLHHVEAGEEESPVDKP
jgi:hypothetical protein